MASSSSIPKSFKYDVFLSFRGEDTRKSFVHHLYHALDKKGITTYKDDENTMKGKSISDDLLRAIEESRLYIIVFSKNYSSSSWCLEELVKIMECQKMAEHTAFPIFYDVEPTEVRNQSGAVGEAFAKHVGKEAVMRWRDAFKAAANLSGWDLRNTADGNEAILIQQVVEYISLDVHFFNRSFDEKLVGMEARAEEVSSSLEMGSNDVRMIGIKGMGGGGKTTLARFIFDHIAVYFEGKSFVENVREVSKGSLSGLKELQKQVLSDVSNEKNIEVTSVFDGRHLMNKMMRSRKVLLVLDDVDDTKQLEVLAGDPHWFKPGSRIIITTRDTQVLVAYKVNFIHNINLLSVEEAICLFSRYAFGTETPVQGYEELSEKVVNYAAGLPLTIKVLGSFLCGRAMREWEYSIERLKRIPLKETLEKLQQSFNDLDDDHKEIFLDVACILTDETKEKAIRILESCGFDAGIGLSVLEQKSLITISDADGLRLHNHVAEMGRNIVRRSHPEEPYNHSRLWIKTEIEDILLNDLGTKATESVKLHNIDLHPDIIIKGLKKMKKLRSLYVHNGYKKWEIDEVSQDLPNGLRSIYWHSYPFLCLAKTFQANMLVNLEMPHSNISQLWGRGEKKVLSKLRFIDLSYSKLRTFDLEMSPNAETLDLEQCSNFVELNMPKECPKLKFLNLSGSKLSHFNVGLAPNLEMLDLRGCDEFVELHIPVVCPKLKFLNLSNTKLCNLNLGLSPNLESLDLGGCNEFIELHIPVECPKLQFLNLSNTKLGNLNLGLSPNLESLDLGGCNELVDLHIPVECPRLKFLNLSNTKLGDLNLGLSPNLENLDLGGCKDFVELHIPVECPKLKFLNLSNTKLSNFNLGLSPNLRRLDLGGCNEFVELHIPVGCPKLDFLDVGGSKLNNINLGLTPNLRCLVLGRCTDFVELRIPIECPKLKLLNLSCSKLRSFDLGMAPNLETLDLGGCYEFVELHIPFVCPKLKSLYLCGSMLSNLNIGMTPLLETLNLRGCNVFVELHMPVECSKLKFLNLSGSKVCNLNLGMTPSLETLDLRGCKNFVELHMPIQCPKLKSLYLRGFKLSNLNIGMAPYLEMLDLGGCSEFTEFHMPGECRKLKFLKLSGIKVSNLSLGLTPHLEKLESLEKLSLSIEDIKYLPDSIFMLKHLKYLKLKSCEILEQLPKDLDRFECLEELHIKDCRSLRDIPNNICKMKCLEYLRLSCCVSVERLPEELGRLECLKRLNIEGTGIIHLPDSISKRKGLCIVWSRERLESYGFTSLEEISRDTAMCYV